MKLSTATEWLFFHLWKKHPDTFKSCPGILIPDTVIYRWAQPFLWYFTNKDGILIRKTKDKISIKQIDEIFTSFVPSSQIVCSYLRSSGEGSTQDQIDFEYCDAKSFAHLLYQGEKALDALLQKFIEPKNKHNSVIKVSWSPQFCLLYKKTNIHLIDDSKIPLNFRAATFEGPEHLCDTQSISSPIFASDIEKICLNIVKHLQEVSGGNIQVARMNLYFKIDEENRIWLLYCSRLKVRDKFSSSSKDKLSKKSHHLERELSPLLRLANQKELVSDPSMLKQIRMNHGLIENTNEKSEKYCANCLKEGSTYEISFQLITESFKSGNLLNENPQKNFQIQKCIYDDAEEDEIKPNEKVPYLLQRVWGRLTYEKYVELCNNPSWLNLKTRVCEHCYLELTKITIEKENEKELRKMAETLKSGSSRKNMKFSSLNNVSQKKNKKALLEEKLILLDASPRSALKKPKISNSSKNESSEMLIDPAFLNETSGDLTKRLNATHNNTKNNASSFGIYAINAMQISKEKKLNRVKSLPKSRNFVRKPTTVAKILAGDQEKQIQMDSNDESENATQFKVEHDSMEKLLENLPVTPMNRIPNEKIPEQDEGGPTTESEETNTSRHVSELLLDHHKKYPEMQKRETEKKPFFTKTKGAEYAKRKKVNEHILGPIEKKMGTIKYSNALPVFRSNTNQKKREVDYKLLQTTINDLKTKYAKDLEEIFPTN